VETGVRLYNPSSWNPFIVRRGETLFQEGKFFYADSTFFKIFSFPLVAGNPTTRAHRTQRRCANAHHGEKYFGEEDPMGKTLQVNNDKEYIVTGVMEDVPSNSLLQFDFVGSFASLAAAKEQIWWSANYQTFVLLAPGTNVQALTDKTTELVKKALASELTNPGDYVKYNFFPLTDIYLRSDMNENQPVGSIQYVYILVSLPFSC